MSFFNDCQGVPHLAGACLPGLQALKAGDSDRITKRPTTVLAHSIDVDEALRIAHPQAARWDYGIAQALGASETVHWIEVHPASGGRNIGEVEAKLDWLRAWLVKSPLAAYERRVVWIASGRAAFNQRSPKLKALANAGLQFVGRHLIL